MTHPADLDPIYVSVKDAARIIAVSPQVMYAKLDQQVIESRYDGRKRLVVLASLREYAAALPDVKPEKAAS